MLSSLNQSCGRYQWPQTRGPFCREPAQASGYWRWRTYCKDPASAGDQQRRRQSTGAPTAALRAQGQVGHLAVHGRRRPAPSTCSTPSRSWTRATARRSRIDVFNGNPGPLMKSPFTFRQYGQCGRVGLREVSERRQARGRHRVRQVVLHRVERPRAGACTR